MAKVPPFIIIRDTYANVVANYSASADGALAYFTDLQCEGVKCNGAWYPSVLSSVDAETGVSQLTTYGNKKATPRNLAADGSFTTKRCPYLKTSTATNDAAGYTYQTIAAAEAPFNAFRVGFLNGESGTVTISKVIGGTAPVVGTGASVFYNILFSGSASVTLPAKLGTNRPSITWSDWLLVGSMARTDGLGSDLPLAVIRAFIGPAQTTFSQTYSGDDLTWLANVPAASTNHGRVWKTQRKAVDAVTTTANWTSPTQVGHCLPMVIEFAHVTRGITVLNIGDSIRVGTPADAAAVTNGDAFQAVIGLSSTSAPISLINAGIGGDNSANYTARAVELIAATRPDVVLFAPFTVNDGTPADYRIAWQLGQFSQVLQAAKAVGAKVIAVNGMCNTSLSWSAAADAQRVALNATLASMGIPVIDQDYYATDGASPARFASGASTDGLHPDSEIYTAITPLTSAAINKVIFN